MCRDDECCTSKHVHVDDLYLHVLIALLCVHEQKAHGLQWVELTNKNAVFVTLVDLANDSKHNEASFSMILMYLL